MKKKITYPIDPGVKVKNMKKMIEIQICNLNISISLVFFYCYRKKIISIIKMIYFLHLHIYDRISYLKLKRLLDEKKKYVPFDIFLILKKDKYFFTRF